MIMTDSFIEWYENASKDDRASVINFVIYTSASLSIRDRISVAIEILLGKKYSMWVSRNQKREDTI